MPACKHDLDSSSFEDGIWQIILIGDCSGQVASRSYGSGRQSNDKHGILRIAAI